MGETARIDLVDRAPLTEKQFVFARSRIGNDNA